MPAGATAVTLGLTVAGASSSSALRAYPTPDADGAPPQVRTLSTTPRGPVSTEQTMGLGTGGRVRLHLDRGSASVSADVHGYFRAAAPDSPDDGSTLLPLEAPKLVLGTDPYDTDTGGTLRRDVPLVLPLRTPELTFAPAKVSAVVLAVTVRGARGTAQVTVGGQTGTPAGPAQLTAGGPVRASTLVTVPTDGSAIKMISSAEVQAQVALVGWFVPDRSGWALTPLAVPTEVYNRPYDALYGERGQQLRIPGSGGVPWTVGAVALSITALDAPAPQHLAVYSAHASFNSAPGTAPVQTLEAVPGRATTGPALPWTGYDAFYEEKGIRLYSQQDPGRLLVDLYGVYLPVGDGLSLGAAQCRGEGSEHPADAGAFVVVAADAGRPFSTNPCAADELAFAVRAGDRRPVADALEDGQQSALLLSAANPGPSDRHWPGDECADNPSFTCAARYGDAAQAAVFDPADQQLLGYDGTRRRMIWLDVDAGGSWAGSPAQNLSAIAGMRRALLRQFTAEAPGGGAYAVGIRSTAADWQAITGGTGQLPDAQVWLRDASGGCPADVGFTGGPVVVVAGSAPVSVQTCPPR